VRDEQDRTLQAGSRAVGSDALLCKCAERPGVAIRLQIAGRLKGIQSTIHRLMCGRHGSSKCQRSRGLVVNRQLLSQTSRSAFLLGEVWRTIFNHFPSSLPVLLVRHAGGRGQDCSAGTATAQLPLCSVKRFSSCSNASTV